jgi:hypothetical protein
MGWIMCAGTSPRYRIVLCRLAEDVNLLQDELFKKILDTLARRRDEVKPRSQLMLSQLFKEMRQGGSFENDLISAFHLFFRNRVTGP